MSKVTLRHVRANIVAVEKQYVLHILSVGLYALKPYCHLRPVRQYNIFFHSIAQTARISE